MNNNELDKLLEHIAVIESPLTMEGIKYWKDKFNININDKELYSEIKKRQEKLYEKIRLMEG